MILEVKQMKQETLSRNAYGNKEDEKERLWKNHIILQA